MLTATQSQYHNTKYLYITTSKRILAHAYFPRTPGAQNGAPLPMSEAGKQMRRDRIVRGRLKHQKKLAAEKAKEVAISAAADKEWLLEYVLEDGLCECLHFVFKTDSHT